MIFLDSVMLVINIAAFWKGGTDFYGLGILPLFQGLRFLK